MPTLTSASDYLENKLLDLVFSGTAFTPPTTVYAQLFTAAPSDTGGGTATGSRAAVTFGAPAARTSSNSALVSITDAASGTITHVGLFDAATAGNLLFWGELDAAVTLVSGDPFEFQIGALDVTFSAGAMTDYLAHALLDHVLRATAYTPPASVTLALLDTADVEVTSGARIALTWGAAASGLVANTNATSYTNGTGASQTIDSFRYHEGAAGQALFEGSLAARSVAAGGTLNVAAGAFTAGMD